MSLNIVVIFCSPKWMNVFLSMATESFLKPCGLSVTKIWGVKNIQGVNDVGTGVQCGLGWVGWVR